MTPAVGCIPLALTTLALVHDLRTREVPDWISAVVLIAGVVATGFGFGAATWVQFAVSVGLALAIGLVLFALGGWGGADVKLLTALAAWFGPWSLLALVFWMAMAGMLLSIAYVIRGRKTLPYIPAIAAGLAIQILWPEALSSIIQH